MKLLLDKRVLLWAAKGSLPPEAAALVYDATNELIFSAASIWEVAIKHGLGREDFKVDPHLLQRGLLDHGYVELTITSEHTLAVSRLPHHHKDPFDRLLVAQAIVEGITLVTADPVVAVYPGPIHRV